MYNKNTSPQNIAPYMYNTAASKTEAERLIGLNKLHNPHTLQFLRPHLKNKKKILELGCGSGNLASDVIKEAHPATSYVGVDRDPAQVKICAESLKKYSTRAKSIQLDVTTEIDKLTEIGPFDLIYCRWLLVHLPKDSLVPILKNIISLISETGILLCEECDNRSVKFQPIDNSQLSSPYDEATNLWLELSQALMAELGNDLEFTPEKMISLLKQASDGDSEIRVEGKYQVILKDKNEKRLISDGYRSSSATLITAYKKKSIEEIIAVFDKCAEDDNVKVSFLTQHIVTYRKLVETTDA